MPDDRIGRCEACCSVHGAEGHPWDEEDVQVNYGGFKGGDPRRFHPDHEMSTEEEIAAWKAACEEAERDPSKRDLPPDGGLEFVDGCPAFTTRRGFGIGVTQ